MKTDVSVRQHLWEYVQGDPMALRIRLRDGAQLSYSFLLKWIFLALVSGAMGCIIVHSFQFLLVGISSAFAAMNLPLPLFSLAGVLSAIVGFQVNRHFTLYDFALAGSGRKAGPSD